MPEDKGVRVGSATGVRCHNSMFGSKLRDGGYTGAACLAALRTPPIVSVICLDPSFTLKNVHLEFYFPKLCIWYRWCRGFIIT